MERLQHWAAWANIGAFFVGVIGVVLLVYQLKTTPQAAPPTAPPAVSSPSSTKPVGVSLKAIVSEWTPIALIVLAIVAGGILHLSAARVGQRSGRTRSKEPIRKVSPRPTVTVFMHQEAQANPALIPAVVALFQDAGWEVNTGRTDLPQHQSGVWVRGATNSERTVAVWALRTLGLTAQIEGGDDDVLQIIVGVVEAEREKVNAEKREATAVEKERDSLGTALEQTQREREDIRGQLGGMEQAWLTCKREFALAQLRWGAERAEVAGAKPQVTIRFAEYVDFGLAEAIKTIIERETKWPVTLDRSNSPVLPPSTECKVVFLLSAFEVYSTLAAIFDEGRLVPGRICARRSPDVLSATTIVIEVLPTVKAQ